MYLVAVSSRYYANTHPPGDEHDYAPRCANHYNPRALRRRTGPRRETPQTAARHVDMPCPLQSERRCKGRILRPITSASKKTGIERMTAAAIRHCSSALVGLATQIAPSTMWSISDLTV